MAHCTSCGSQLVGGAKFCSDCGATQTAAAGNQGAFALGQTEAITRAFMKKKPIYKNWWFWLLALIGIPVILFILFTVAEDIPSERAVSAKTTQAAGIAMPGASAGFAGEQYQTVVAQLRSAGFKNVRAEELCDVLMGAQDEDGLVDSVSVDGSTDYDEENVFPENAKIIVSYHAMPAMPESAMDFPLDNYPSAVTKLKDAGFNNIKLEGIGDLITGWLHSEGDIKAVTVNGSGAFVADDRFPKDVPIVIAYHSYEKSAEYAIQPEAAEPGDIALPASALNFIAKDYRAVAADLEKAGFTDIKIEKLEDLITGWLYKDGEVAKITVNGVTDFYTDKWFPADAKIIVTYHTFPPSVTTVAATTKAAAATAATTAVTATAKPTAKNDLAVLNAKNSTDMAAVLKTKPDNYSAHRAFADKYKGKTIEFDGCIGLMMDHVDVSGKKYNTRFDCAMYAVDYDETPVTGPTFSFIDVNCYDFNVAGANPKGTVGEGDNVHIVAKIVGYKEKGHYIELEPVSTKLR